MLLVGYKKCSTCRGVEKSLEALGLDYSYRPIEKENPSVEELKTWHEQSGLDIKKFFNTSGIKYRELGLKDKLPAMTLEEKYDLLASDGMLVKRPILLTDQDIYVGPQVKKYLSSLEEEKK
ncbi:arsenate reductase family protein [Atopobacter sp. AH10]|uniref:arsenate reductase family protein n=1 Tax=Atopobacter sp. AH10 TaxID=2315861 RepID=UPI000EF23E7B|nr:arsenate reductase family protein [Atopobacter sp. AH10]RLK63310.1 arsenate reductase family protein [Atopobacter sp. AH10]